MAERAAAAVMSRCVAACCHSPALLPGSVASVSLPSRSRASTENLVKCKGKMVARERFWELKDAAAELILWEIC